MNESEHTAKLLRELRRVMRGATVVKLSDNYTRGLPDFFVTTTRGVTTWFEAKLIVGRERLGVRSATVTIWPKRDVPLLQWETLRRLVRGHVVVYTAGGVATFPVRTARHLALPSFDLELASMTAAAEKIGRTCEERGW